MVSVKPEKMLVLLWDKGSFHCGTSENPIELSPGILTFTKFCPAVNEKGDFQVTGTKQISFPKAYWRVVNYSTSGVMGIPKMGMGVGDHPENPIFKNINLENISMLKELEAELRQKDNEIKTLRIKLDNITTSAGAEFIKQGKMAGETIKGTKAYGKQRDWNPFPVRRREYDDDY